MSACILAALPPTNTKHNTKQKQKTLSSAAKSWGTVHIVDASWLTDSLARGADGGSSFARGRLSNVSVMSPPAAPFSALIRSRIEA